MEDFAELEVPAVPEMPVPSFEQQPAETEPEPAATEPEPAEETPEPAAEHVVEQSAEQATDEPAEQAAEEAQPSTHYVVVRLREGDSLRIGEHGSAAEASAQAAEAVVQISAAASSGTWPLFSGRYLNPDTIVSVDLVEASPDA